MKKIIILGLLVLCMVLALVACGNSGNEIETGKETTGNETTDTKETGKETEPVHQHTWVAEVLKDRCESYESTRKCSECQYEEKYMVEGKGHALTQNAAKAPTCTEGGWAAYETCSRCDYTTKVELKATGHNYSMAYTSDATNHWHVCLNCNEIQAKEAHVSSGAATETKDEYCTVCGYIITPNLNHVHSSHVTLVAAKDATCTLAGNTAYYVCTCGKFFEDAAATKEIANHDAVIVKALGHDIVQHEAKEATCTEKGWNAYVTCKRCTYTTLKETFPLRHDFVAEWSFDGEYHWHDCSRCDEVAFKYAHQTAGAATETTDEVCLYCGAVLKPATGHVHKAHLTKVVAKEATCTEDGNTEYFTCSCGNWYADANAKNIINDHDSVVVASNGHNYVNHICTVCNDKEEYTIAGVIVAMGSNQSGDVTSVIVADSNKDTFVINLDKETIATLSIGMQVSAKVTNDPASTATGSYDVSCQQGISIEKTSNDLVAIDYSAIECVTLETEEDYNKLFNAPYTELTLFKIVNPYFCRSTSSNTNFFRFGATADQAKNGLNKTQYSAFYMRSTDGINNNATILDEMGVKLAPNVTAVSYDGYSIYAFGVYRGKTTMQFIIPGTDAITLSKEATDNLIIGKFDKVVYDASTEDGEIVLPNIENITWTCDNGLLTISGNKATFTKQTGDDKITKLIGTYQYGGKDVKVEIEITLTAAVIPTLTISDLTADGVVEKLECVVVGIAPSHGGDIAKYNSYGIYVSDGTKIALLAANKTDLAVAGYVYTIGGTPVKVGDKLLMTNVQYTASSKGLKAADDFTIEVTEQNVDVSGYSYSGMSTTTVTTQAEFEALVTGTLTKNMNVVKIVATAENPIYLSAQNAYLLAVDYLTDAKKTDTTGTAFKYSGKVFSANVLPFAAVFGDAWTIANTPVKTITTSAQYGSTASIQNKDNYACETYSFTGTLYMVYEYTTSTNYIFNGVLGGSTLAAVE